jgi:hypothetical protein
VHLQERVVGAIRSINEISNLQLLSLKTAIGQFEAKVVPALTCGLEISWEHLTVKQLQSIESIKARYLKRSMGFSKYTPSRLTYVLARETFLLEDIMWKCLLQSTTSVKEALRFRMEKLNNIWEEFYATDAMTTNSWKNSNQELRHVITRLAVHGFHSRVCSNEKFHEPNRECVSYVVNSVNTYHLQACTRRAKSMFNHAKDGINVHLCPPFYYYYSPSLYVYWGTVLGYVFIACRSGLWTPDCGLWSFL